VSDSPFWLILKQQWTIEELSIFFVTTGLSDTILKGTHPGTIPARFGVIWFSGFREENLNVIFYQNMLNLHNRYQWLLLLKIEFFSIVLCCFIINQNELIFYLQLHDNE
jgi:hypothetical protein